MINRLGEKDQVNIMMKSLLPGYFNRMLLAPIMNFEQLYDCGTRIEYAMKNGKIERNEGRVTSNKTYGQAKTPPKPMWVWSTKPPLQAYTHTSTPTRLDRSKPLGLDTISTPRSTAFQSLWTSPPKRPPQTIRPNSYAQPHPQRMEP